MNIGKLKNRHYLILALILSVLIHGLISFFFLNNSFYSRIYNLINTITQSSLKTETIAALNQSLNKRLETLNEAKKRSKMRAPKNGFGWVLFDNQPAAPRLTALPESADGPVGASGTVLAGDHNAQIDDGKDKIKDVIEQPDAINSPSNHTEHLDHEITKPIEGSTSATLSSTSINGASVVLQTQAPAATAQVTIIKNGKQEIVNVAQDELAAKIDAIKAFQNALESGRPLRSFRKSTTTLSKQQQALSRIRGVPTKNQSKNIIALTRGFIEKIDGEEGFDLIDQDGDETIKASVEEMKIAQFEAKVTWCLQATWKKHFAIAKKWESVCEANAVIEFDINKLGKVIEVRVLESTGKPDLDMRIIKTAELSTPFPPAPKEMLSNDICTIHRWVRVFSENARL